MLREFLLSFIPLFVAVDALGNIPFFVSLTSGMIPKQRRAIINESVSVACLLAISFMLVGKWLLRAMGITVYDFKIAGGILLLVLSVYFLLPGRNRFTDFSNEQSSIGIFPLAAPMITGPAVLTTTLIIVGNFGIQMALISVILNMIIVWVVFLSSGRIFRFMGKSGSRAFSKVSDILLAAIAVMLIRQGIIEAFFYG